ncbi:MAG: glycosyltransferase family 2 protein [Actinomycetota bacterium]|nr:glycosyltransferase family 2 protein [Actinomycetota bacterium]
MKVETLDLSIAVISWNTKDLLKDCLTSIFEKGCPFEVIVVDNNSTDGSVEMVKKEFPEVRLIQNPINIGYAKACNQAIEASRGKYIFLLNSDTRVFPKASDRLVEFMENHEDVGVVGPLLLNPNGSIQYSCRNFPSFGEAMVHAFFGVIFPSNPISRKYKMADWDHKSERVVDWVSGAAICLRRKALEDVGFFDEGYFMYVEDLDLCYRMWKKGWRVYFTPDARVVHYIAESSKRQSMPMIIEFQKSMYRFYSKRYGNSWKRYLKLLVALGLCLRGCLLVCINFLRRRK